MGRSLGAFDDDVENFDNPELNKCPDCGSFFAGENCPICGKLCPPEMRAGNRPAVKKKKSKRAGSGRVTFIEWYHSWWFIALMFLVFPIVGFVLLFTSPYAKKWKAVFAVLALLFVTGRYLYGGQIAAAVWQKIYGPAEETVDFSISEEEYRARCAETDPEALYRGAADFAGRYVRLTVTVEEVSAEYDGERPVYLCRAEGDFPFLLRDCRRGGENFIAGDVITVYGEAREKITAYPGGAALTRPGVNMAYADRRK